MYKVRIDFMDSMTEEGDINTEFISVRIDNDSRVKDQTIKETKLGEAYGAFIIYIKRDEKYINSLELTLRLKVVMF